MAKLFVSWSGGKDSCFACYRAMASDEVCYLVNSTTEDGKRSWTHGLSSALLRMQSEAVGIPLLQQKTTMADYEKNFKSTIFALKREGVEGGVFGDIDMQEHRDWVEKLCRETAITPHLPLWGQCQEAILRDFVASGFEAVMVAARADIFGEEWLGRKIDLDFIRQLAELRETKEVTPCGEAGEYHTFVVAGPLFSQRIEIRETKKVRREGHWFLDILEAKLRAK